ncbi:zinc ribbon domain-containing protein [Methanolobus bombayensis]|uniref:zinc ribbon domain-containing protein n=1 Tax=Methanolobus bombayensis TaxID=38023 RepID=UPI001AE22B8D|nr:zinc ribbon domain-containing protein [Methanolobus bombayensis]MBP1909069.1 hypothetical protein [Methanolobus bombayensis]
MLVQKSLRIPLILFFLFSIISFSIGVVSASDDELIFAEDEIIEVQDGYYLNIVDIDTYDHTVGIAVSYYDTLVQDQYYAEGDYFSYRDDYLTLQFRIDDVYYDSFYGYDYVVISDIYIYPDYTVDYDSTDVITRDSDDYTDYTEDYRYDYSDYDYSTTSDEDAFYEMFGTLIVIFVIVLVLRKLSKKKNKKKSFSEDEANKSFNLAEFSKEKRSDSSTINSETTNPAAADLAKSSKNKPVVIKSAIQYKGANILYKIKVENTSDEPMGDITISLFVPDVFRIKDSQKNISMLQPGEGKAVTFSIRPTGECGDCIFAGNIRYYDYNRKKHVQMDLSNKMVNIVCPVLKVKEIDENAWRMSVSSMMIAEEDTKDLEIPAENLFDISTRILKDMNMYMITPEITSTQQLFTGVARFYAEGVAGMKYAAYIEVVGKRKSRLIVKAWAEKEEGLTGFYHKILEEIEKRTDIKLFVDDSVTQYNISNTTIQDSVIQRSNIGNGKRKCPQCGRETGNNEKFCVNCGQKLE